MIEEKNKAQKQLKKKKNRWTSKLREELKEDSQNSFRGQIYISTGMLLLKCDNVMLKLFLGFILPISIFVVLLCHKE